MATSTSTYRFTSARVGGGDRGTLADLSLLTWPAIGALPVRAVVTTRGGGVSDGPYDSLNLGLHVGDDAGRVLQNRARAAAAIDLRLDDLVFCNQAHGREVVVVDRGMAGRGARSLDDAVDGADALATTDPGVGLVVMVADCVPIVVVDPRRPALACIHAGWRGTVADVVGATVEALVSGGSHPNDLHAALGPAIAPDAYQVGKEVLEAVVSLFGDTAEAVIQPDNNRGRWLMDLWAANVELLRRAGVPDGQVSVAGVATGPGSPFFSDRAVRPCGRFGLLAVLEG